MIKQAFKKGGRVKIWLFMHGVGGVSWYVFWLLNKENLLYIPMILQHFVVSSRNRIHSCNVLGNIYNESTLIRIRSRKTMNLVPIEIDN